MTAKDVIKVVSDEILQAAGVLRVKLDGLSYSDPDSAEKLLAEINEIINNSGSPAPNVTAQPTPATISLSPAEEVIVEFLAHENDPQTIDQILECAGQAESDLKKSTLAVRLHRMVQSKKLTNPSRGLYSVSNFVRAGYRPSQADNDERHGKSPN